MSTTFILMLSTLGAALLFLACWTQLLARSGRRARDVDQERVDAWRRLYERLDDKGDQAHFTYCPASCELVLDARAARLVGLQPEGGEVRLNGWQALPGCARPAGWIDEALADGLVQKTAVSCEYLARQPGQPDGHFMLTAEPAPLAGLLIGVLARKPRGAGAPAALTPVRPAP